MPRNETHRASYELFRTVESKVEGRMRPGSSFYALKPYLFDCRMWNGTASIFFLNWKIWVSFSSRIIQTQRGFLALESSVRRSKAMRVKQNAIVSNSGHVIRFSLLIKSVKCV